MLLNNVEFDFKATRGSDYKRYVHGRNAALAAINALDTNDEDYLIHLCEIVDDFFADLLGDDYADKLGIDTDDVEPLLALLEELNRAAAPESFKSLAAPQDVTELPANVTSSISLNRAQRRAARKAARANKPAAYTAYGSGELQQLAESALDLVAQRHA